MQTSIGKGIGFRIWVGSAPNQSISNCQRGIRRYVSFENSGNLYPILSFTDGERFGDVFSPVKWTFGQFSGKPFHSSPNGPKITRSGTVLVASVFSVTP